MNPVYILSSTNTQGSVAINTVSDNPGTVLTYNPTTKEISTRTNTELISDLSLMTANTVQHITNRKFFDTYGSNWGDNSLIVYAINPVNPAMTFYKEGVGIGQIMFDGSQFNLKNSENSGYQYIRTEGFIKSGSDNSYVLLGGGEHKKISELEINSLINYNYYQIQDLNNYLEAGKMKFTPAVLQGSPNLFPTANNANALLSISTWSDNVFGHDLGFSSDGSIYHRYKGYGSSPSSWGKLWSSNNINPVTLDTNQTIIGSKIFAQTSNVAFYGNEYNNVEIWKNSVNAGIGGVVSGHVLSWYNTRWKVGNARSGSVASEGYAFWFSSDEGLNYTQKVIIGTDGNIQTNQYGDSAQWNEAYNLAINAVKKSGDTMTGGLRAPNIYSNNFITDEDNTMIRIGNNGDVGIVKKANYQGFFAVADQGFIVKKAITSSGPFTANSTFTDLFSANASGAYVNGNLIWDQHNFNPDNKVNKNGDTMSGALTINIPNGTVAGNGWHLNLTASNLDNTNFSFLIPESNKGQIFVGNSNYWGSLDLQPFGGDATLRGESIATQPWINNYIPSYNNWGSSDFINQRKVVGELTWRAYGNGHTIFDASNSFSPTGLNVNNTNAQHPWVPTYPALMGWNGSETFGVRVDSARVADGVNGYDLSTFATTSALSGYVPLTGTNNFTGILRSPNNRVQFGNDNGGLGSYMLLSEYGNPYYPGSSFYMGGNIEEGFSVNSSNGSNQSSNLYAYWAGVFMSASDSSGSASFNVTPNGCYGDYKAPTIDGSFIQNKWLVDNYVNLNGSQTIAGGKQFNAPIVAAAGIVNPGGSELQVFIGDGSVANMDFEITNEGSDIRLRPGEYDVPSSGFLEISDPVRIIRIFGEQNNQTVNLKDVFPRQEYTIYNSDPGGNNMTVQINGTTVGGVNAGFFITIYIRDNLSHVIHARAQFFT